MTKDNNIFYLTSRNAVKDQNNLSREVDAALVTEFNSNDYIPKDKSKPLKAQALRLWDALTNRFAASEITAAMVCLALALVLWIAHWLLPETVVGLNMAAIRLILDMTIVFSVIYAVMSALRIRKIYQTTFKEI